MKTLRGLEMPKIIKITVNECLDCPHYEEYEFGFGGVSTRWCKNLDQEVLGRTFLDNCPLEDVEGD